MSISPKLISYTVIADMIAASIGEECEVIIHDLSTPQNSVVHVANGYITNRQVGQSFEHLVKDVLLSKNFINDSNANYHFVADNGNNIKSSTCLIRDDDSVVIGALCINIRIDNFLKMKDFLSDFTNDNQHDKAPSSSIVETFGHVTEVIDKLIEKTIDNADLGKITKVESIRILTFFHHKGIFLIKGSIDKVATKLGISRVTVYSHLDEIKKDLNSNRHD